MDDARLVRILFPWERRHPRLFARLPIGGGVVQLALGAILVGYGVWWGLLVLPVAALTFYTAYRLPRAISAVNGSIEQQSTRRQ
jgi:hypothetical protein